MKANNEKHLELYKEILLQRAASVRGEGNNLGEAVQKLEQYKAGRKESGHRTYLEELEAALPEDGLLVLLYLLFYSLDMAFKRKTQSSGMEATVTGDMFCLIGFDLQQICSILFTSREIPGVLQKLDQLNNLSDYIDDPDTSNPCLQAKVMNGLISGKAGDVRRIKNIRVTIPKVTLDDVILPVEIREEMRSVAAGLVENRKAGKDGRFQRGVRGTTPVFLFEGLPGTGKTLTAHGLAGTVGLPIVEIPDLVHYMRRGEPGRAVHKMFEEIGRMECLLLIDDFDKLFGEINVGSFLEMLENTPNPVVLTANNACFTDHDYAVYRRITRNFLFPVPSAKDRRLLWTMHLPSGYSFASDADLDKTVRYFLIPGGNIKNVLLSCVIERKDEKKIRFADLRPFLFAEIGKMLDPVDNLITMVTGQKRDVQETLQQALMPVARAMESAERLADTLPSPTTIGLLTDYTPVETCIAFSRAIDMPVIIKRLDMENEDLERANRNFVEMFLKSLPRSEYTLVHWTNDDDLVKLLNRRALQDRINFVLVSNVRWGLSLHEYFNYCFRFRKEDMNASEIMELSRMLQEHADFDLTGVCPEAFKPYFLKYLKFHWVLNGRGRITRPEADNILDSFSLKKPKKPPLFGPAHSTAVSPRQDEKAG